MNIQNLVTLRYLKKNKLRTAVTVVGILLSAAMTAAVFTLAFSLRDWLVADVTERIGGWHGRVDGASPALREELEENGKVKEAVFLQRLGYAPFGEGNDLRPYLYLLGCDTPESVLPITLTEGRMPEKEGELLLPESLREDGVADVSLGEKLTLTLGLRRREGETLWQNIPVASYTEEEEESFAAKEERDFTVVGFCREPYRAFDGSPFAPGYIALTVSSPSFPESGVGDLFFKMKNPAAFYTFIQKEGIPAQGNTELLRLTGAMRSGDIRTMLFGLAAVVLLLIFCGSVALIYSAFAISVSERTKQFGLLSSVGATKRQLRRTVLFEACAVSVVGIPAGILCGVVGIGITLAALRDKIQGFLAGSVPLSLHIPFLALLLSAVLSLLTVLVSAWIPSRRATKISAVEAIRQNGDLAVPKRNKTSRVIGKLFGLPGLLADKYFKRSRMKSRATVFSLTVSIVLFITASAFTDYLVEEASAGLSDVPYDLVLYASGHELESPTPEEWLTLFKAADSVTGAAYERISREIAALPKADLTEEGLRMTENAFGLAPDGENARVGITLAFVNEEAYAAFLAERKLDPADYLDPEAPRAVVVDRLTAYNEGTKRYETVDYCAGKNPRFFLTIDRDVPGYELIDVSYDEEDNRILTYRKESAGEGEEELLVLDGKEVEVKLPLDVGTVVTEKPWFLPSTDGLALLYPLDAVKTLFGEFPDRENSFTPRFFFLSSDHAASREAVGDLLESYGVAEGGLIDIAEENESNRNLITVVKVFAYGFTALLSLIAALNVFSTVTTDVGLRKRDFAMLKSVGMSKRDFSKMRNFECLFYGARALLFGIPISLLLVGLIHRAVNKAYRLAFRLPWGAIGISMVGVFLLVFLTMAAAMKSAGRGNLAEALKNENL